ncbi:integrase core domain protein [Ferrimicrobium acidiphilum DSM 19497]|nr:integrase core domain protein [Ferrimicrobium acidiphilum DSM 19497]
MVESFTVSNDPEFTEKVRDVAGIYLNPPEAAIVLCVDEKTQVQALDRTQPIRPMVPGVPLRQTTEYKRNGISNLYAALNVASGKVITKMTVAHRAIEFIEFLEIIDKNVPKELGVHVVLDNYAAHKTESVRMWLLAHPRFQFHFTPTYSSWMNQVERWFSALTTKYLQRSVHHSVTELNEGITEWAEAWNKNPKPFIWTKSADEIFASMQKYLGPSVSEQTSD